MQRIIISSNKSKEIIDITDDINQLLANNKSVSGLCYFFLTHTTAALTTADLDPGTDLDILDAIENLIPKLSYRHPHNPAHTKDHIASALVGTDLTIPFENKRLVLGTWQRVVLVEFNGPKEREIMVSVVSA